MTEEVSAFDTRPRPVPEAASPPNTPISLPAHFNVWWGLLLPAATLMTLTVVLTGEWDMRVASWVYAWGDNAWSYKNGFLDRPEFCRHSVAALRVAPFKLYR